MSESFREWVISLPSLPPPRMPVRSKAPSLYRIVRTAADLGAEVSVDVEGRVWLPLGERWVGLNFDLCEVGP